MRLIAILLLAGCGSFTKEPETAPKADPRVDELRSRQTEWHIAIETASFPKLTDCDLALWAGEGAASGATVDLTGFESNGAIRRNPSNPCTPASRDMVLGYVYGRWAQGDLKALERVADYGEAHNWQMSSNAANSWIDPIGSAIIAHAIDDLSRGQDKRSYEGVPLDCFHLSKDYEQHLVVTEAMFGAEVAELTKECVSELAKYAAGSPGDALFQASHGSYSGDMGDAFTLLLDDNYSCPTYVRPESIYCTIHKAFAAHVVLRSFKI